MKKFTLLSLLLGAALGLARPAAAQTAITIAQARAQAPAYNASGATVRLRGIVTNGPELGAIRYIQDGTAGIGVYSATMTTGVVPGDSIEVVGTLKDYRGLLELDPVTSLTVLAGNKPLPAPVTIPAANMLTAYAESYEGQLVKFTGVSSVTTTSGGAVSAFTSTTFRLNNGSGSPTPVIYVNAASNGADGIIGKPAPSGAFDVVGIMSQYTLTASATGYQLLPRLFADFQQGNTPNLITTPMPTNISTSGFTVNFTTMNAGDTKLEYGTSATGPFTTVSNAASVTQHGLAITGLQPATVYYVKASSTNSVGLSESRVVPMITASLSSGKMRTYFTTSVNTSYATPGNNAVGLSNFTMPDTIARYIGLAQQTLDIAIYNWNNSTILNAVNAAQARGVQVRVIYEEGNANVSIPQLNSAIPRIGRQTTQNIMHNKFVVIDANSTNPNRPWVWTGSTNWTSAQLTTDRNNAIAVQDQSLARVYKMEFDEMWGGGTVATALFGSRKTDNTPHYLNIGGKSVESWFSPTDNVNGRLIQVVQTADNDLHVATMLITQSDIGRAIRDQVLLKNIGSCSEAILNDTSNTGTGVIFRNIKSALGNRAQIYNKTGIFHHKYVIIDAGAALSDPTVFTGSHNWSLSANTENDENTLIVHDAKIVNQYYQEFAQRLIDQNVTGVTPCQLILAAKDRKVTATPVQVYPNPAHNTFRVKLADEAKANTATLTLRDMLGRTVLTRTVPVANGQELNVDVTGLARGIYQVLVELPGSTQTSRVVVQ